MLVSHNWFSFLGSEAPVLGVTRGGSLYKAGAKE